MVVGSKSRQTAEASGVRGKTAHRSSGSGSAVAARRARAKMAAFGWNTPLRSLSTHVRGEHDVADVMPGPGRAAHDEAGDLGVREEIVRPVGGVHDPDAREAEEHAHAAEAAHVE